MSSWIRATAVAALVLLAAPRARAGEDDAASAAPTEGAAPSGQIALARSPIWNVVGGAPYGTKHLATGAADFGVWLRSGGTRAFHYEERNGFMGEFILSLVGAAAAQERANRERRTVEYEVSAGNAVATRIDLFEGEESGGAVYVFGSIPAGEWGFLNDTDQPALVDIGVGVRKADDVTSLAFYPGLVVPLSFWGQLDFHWILAKNPCAEVELGASFNLGNWVYLRAGGSYMKSGFRTVLGVGGRL